MRQIGLAVVGFVLVAFTGARAQTISTVAGGGSNSPTALAADITWPTSVAVDSAGNVYVTAPQLDQIYKIGPSGSLTLVAGTGYAGYSGDGGPATRAALDLSGLYIGVLESVALDAHGNLFFSDESNRVIRRVDAVTGIITTVAGNGTAGYSGDGGAATDAQLWGPRGMALDSAGDLYIADVQENAVRRVDAVTGIITTVAGNATAGFSGDGGPATDASLNYPYFAAVSADGHLFIGDAANNRVREVVLPPFIAFSPSSLAFAAQQGHTDSAAQTITVINTGAVALRIRSIRISGDFHETHTCRRTLDPGSSCTISVQFAPKSAGSLDGSITVEDKASGSPQSITLSGTGTAPPHHNH